MTAAHVGFFGKLPSHGDFLRRRTSDAFVQIWDGWLQRAMAASRETLGDGWVDLYLTSPAWRFAAAAGACGTAPLLGVMVPSVDRVGRYFPLTIVTELPDDASVVAAFARAAPFYDAAEQIAIDTLEAEYVDFEKFDRDVRQLEGAVASALICPAVALDQTTAAVFDGGQPVGWQLPIESATDVGAALTQVSLLRLSAAYQPVVLWWTDGSAAVDPSCLVSRGLPDPASFAAFLDGDWHRHLWRPASARIARPSRTDDLAANVPMSMRSAAASDVGRVRKINQDSFLERPEAGLWVVADGLGGHSDGELASRMVCDALAEMPPGSSLDECVREVRTRMQAVNDHLLLASARSLRGDRSGSTVVVLLVRGRRCAVLWAGDSRVYRFRGGRLEQLTQDHSPAEMAGVAGRTSNAVTRAVGAQSTIELDLVDDTLRPGDRYLLCSDGLTRMVPDSEISILLGQPDPRTAVEGLIAATLAAGAPDNVTALLVEAFEFS